MSVRRTHQQEGPDVGDLVELHEEPQSLLVVAAVLAVDGEALPLQGGGGGEKFRVRIVLEDWRANSVS